MRGALAHGDAQDIHAPASEPNHRAGGVLDKIQRIGHVDVRRLGVRHHQDKATEGAASPQLGAGVPQRCTESGGETGLEPGEPTARRDPERFVEILDPRQSHALAPIGSEGQKRHWIARRVKRVAK